MMSDFRFLYIILLAVAVTGCGNQSVDGEYEQVEHFVPDHWPQDLLDASSKIDQRASQLSGQLTTDVLTIEKQLRDIVGWVPEVAADTDLTEQQWNPIYFASEKLSKRLAKIPRPLDDATLGAINEYRKLLLETAKLLPPEEEDAEEPEDDPEDDPEDPASEPVAMPRAESVEESQ